MHHDLDIHPYPDQPHLFINEPWLIDDTYSYKEQFTKEPDEASDNIRIYIPLDLNHTAILNRLNCLISSLGPACEDNEMEYSWQVYKMIGQLEIYDQIWFTREGACKEGSSHSEKGVQLATKFIRALEDIDDYGAVLFPFDIIEELKEEWLV